VRIMVEESAVFCRAWEVAADCCRTQRHQAILKPEWVQSCSKRLLAQDVLRQPLQ
jgi:hypothetical protein